MYQKYQTETLVLGSREMGENDRLYALYTRDFGLVRARASAVRKETSRMRYALQNYSRAEVGLVRGKRGWRLAGAAALEGARDADVFAGLSTFARVARLVLRLVAGEEANPHLFEVLIGTQTALLRERREAHATIELIGVARVLFGLGYISAEALDTAIFTQTGYADSHLREAELLRDALLASINHAMLETHL